MPTYNIILSSKIYKVKQIVADNHQEARAKAHLCFRRYSTSKDDLEILPTDGHDWVIERVERENDDK